MQDYRVIDIDPKIDREQLVMVEIKLGSGASGLSIDLFSADVTVTGTPIEQNSTRVQHSILCIYDMFPEGEGLMLFPIKPGESYQLGVTGNWGSAQGTKNDVEITIRMDDY